MTDAGQGARRVGHVEHFVQGTFAQINADLATLQLHGGRHRGAGQISLQVYDQLGLSATADLPVSIAGGGAARSPTITGTARRRQHRRHGRPHHDQLGRRKRQHLSVGHRRCRHHRQRRQHGDGFYRRQHHHHGIWQRRLFASVAPAASSTPAGRQYDLRRRHRQHVRAAGNPAAPDNFFGYVLQNSDLFDLRPLLAATTWNGARRRWPTSLTQPRRPTAPTRCLSLRQLASRQARAIPRRPSTAAGPFR